MKYEHISLYMPDVILIALHWFVETNSFLVPLIAVSAVAGVVIIVAVILVIMLIKQRTHNKGPCTRYILILIEIEYDVNVLPNSLS